MHCDATASSAAVTLQEDVTSYTPSMQHSQLQRLFYEMKQLLSFDIVSDLPEELAEKVFSYLDAPSLCTAAQCCRSWREITNRDALW